MREVVVLRPQHYTRPSTTFNCATFLSSCALAQVRVPRWPEPQIPETAKSSKAAVSDSATLEYLASEKLELAGMSRALLSLLDVLTHLVIRGIRLGNYLGQRGA
jgi:hypothetical protein